MLKNINFKSISDKRRVVRQDSVAGSVYQATGLPDFEDGSRTGTKLEVRNGPQIVCTIPGINLAIGQLNPKA